MLPALRRSLLFMAVPLTLAAAPNLSSAPSSAALPQLSPEAVVVPKAPIPLPDEARRFLIQRDGDYAKVWVFFTDKGVFSRAEFESSAATVPIGDAAMKRRARTGMDKVVFADLPVRQDYVDQIVGLGAILRWKSTWLNAASFIVPSDKLDAVAGLPFVVRIQPIAEGKRVLEPLGAVPDDTRTDISGTALSPTVLNYGSAAAQLAQIGVPAAHNKGFHGEGVTLAMFDTGFRTSHEAFASTFSEGRFIAEYDFVFHDNVTSNQPEDNPGAWNHGTLTWSTAAGLKDGQLYGPAFKSKIILCKTEDIRSETVIEEDNWLAAVEWVSTLGADVISSSLSYSDWYTNVSYDGRTCISTKAANLADSLGILVVNAAGNSGPTSPSIGAPADALYDITVGAVYSDNTLTSFSSRGPTYDGRIKPEVCARGSGTACATSGGDNTYGSASGTSLSTPLVAGAACLLIQAHPGFTPRLIRQSLMETANNASSPNNNYGWGVINTDAALSWGASIAADIVQGNAPMTVNFTGTSSAYLSPSSWLWDFGDGNTSTNQNPVHVYTLPGSYTVSLTVETAYGPISNSKPAFIAAFGDTLRFVGDSAFAGQKVMVSVRLTNSQALQSMVLPIRLPVTPFRFSLDSIRKGTRTSYFESMSNLSQDPLTNRYTVELVADNGGGAPMLSAGDGEVLRIYGFINKFALGGSSAVVDTADLLSFKVHLVSSLMSYGPAVFSGEISTKAIQRCDVDYSNDGILDISDISALIGYLYLSGQTPLTIQSADCDADFGIDIADLTWLIGYLFLDGPPPVSP
jgi:subtilisin family serine protease